MTSDDRSRLALPDTLVARAADFRRAHFGTIPGALAVDDVQEIAEILTQAFETLGIQATIVGGSALMLQVPMLDPSNDVDIVLEERTGRAPSTERVADVMHTLGFVKEPGRHWSLGGCFVEFPGGGIDEPVDRMGAPGSMLHVLSVEAMLVQRLSSYRSTGATAHGAQAAFIIRAIGARLDMARLAPLATREGVVAYYNAVRTLALGTPTTALDEQTFRDLYWAMKTPRVTAAEAVSRVSAARVRAETPAPPALTEPSTVPNTPSP